MNDRKQQILDAAAQINEVVKRAEPGLTMHVYGRAILLCLREFDDAYDITDDDWGDRLSSIEPKKPAIDDSVLHTYREQADDETTAPYNRKIIHALCDEVERLRKRCGDD